MKKWAPLIVFVTWAIYTIFGMVFTINTTEKYTKMAKKKADANQNGRLEAEEVLDVYKTLGYDGEKLFTKINPDEQAFLIAELAREKANEGRVEEFVINIAPWLTAPEYTLDRFSKNLLRILVDSDRNRGISFKEAMAVLRELCEKSVTTQSCQLRLDHTRPEIGPLDVLFNPWNLNYGSELQRYATGQ